MLLPLNSLKVGYCPIEAIYLGKQKNNYRFREQVEMVEIRSYSASAYILVNCMVHMLLPWHLVRRYENVLDLSM